MFEGAPPRQGDGVPHCGSVGRPTSRPFASNPGTDLLPSNPQRRSDPVTERLPLQVQHPSAVFSGCLFRGGVYGLSGLSGPPPERATLSDLSLQPPCHHLPTTHAAHTLPLTTLAPPCPLQPHQPLLGTHSPLQTAASLPLSTRTEHTSHPLRLGILAPALHHAAPAAQRYTSLGATTTADFPRPGRPSFATFRASAPRGRSAVDLQAATSLVTALMHRGKVGAQGPIPTFADNLMADLLSVHEGVGDWPVSVLVWGTLRAATADGPSVLRYFRHVAAMLKVHAGWDVMAHPLVVAFAARVREVRGDHVAGTPAVILRDDYFRLLEMIVDPRLRAMLVIAWRRMARIADVLEIRHHGLWLGPSSEQIWIEAPFSKTNATGQWDRYLIVVSPRELLALLPYTQRYPPSTPPLRRPLLFAGITTRLMADTLSALVGRKVGAHTLRRSALTAAIEAGVPVPTAILLSGHTSPQGAAPYILTPDLVTASGMATASAATVLPPVWSSAAPADFRASLLRPVTSLSARLPPQRLPP